MVKITSNITVLLIFLRFMVCRVVLLKIQVFQDVTQLLFFNET